MEGSNPTEAEKLRSFIDDLIPDAEKALQKLYPTREDILQDGQEKLYLLYIPLRKIEPKGKDYPIPAGEAQREWKKITSVICKNRSAKTIPASPFIFQKGFPRTLWLLYLNLIPKKLWPPIFLILLNHDLRLKRLSSLYRYNKVLDEIKNDLLAKKKALASLKPLLKLKEHLKQTESSQLVEHASELLELIGNTPNLPKENLLPQIEEQQQRITRDWKESEGPSKRFTKDAIYYVKPFVIELFDYFYLALKEWVPAEYDKRVDTDYKTRWEDSSEDPVADEIYRITGDLLRCFFPWEQFTSSEMGIELPEWGDFLFWYPFPPEKRSQYIKAGKSMRDRFGDRIKKIASK